MQTVLYKKLAFILKYLALSYLLFIGYSCSNDEFQETSIDITNIETVEIIEQEELEIIDYSFYVAGHTYGKPGVDNVGVHPPFKAKFDLLNSDENIAFGIFTGDIVWTSTELNWDEIDADLATLDKPVYFAAGNHDVANRELFESRYGTTIFSFIHNSDLFIVLDPNLDGWNISGEQLNFLQSEIENKANQVSNIIILTHQLLWWTPSNIYSEVRPNSFAGRSDTVNFWTEIEPLFHSLENNVVFIAGDVGAFPNGSEFMYDTYDNITLIASGMGGEQRDNIVIADVYQSGAINYRLIALNGDDINALGDLEDYELP